MPKVQYGNKGFSLLELMVALTISVAIGISSYHVLQTSINSERSLATPSNTLLEFQNAFWILSQDLINSDPKTLGSNQDNSSIAFNRRAAEGSIRNARSNIIYVRYYLDKNILVREYRSFEMIQQGSPVSQSLLSDVEDFKVSRPSVFLIEITIKSKKMGLLKRMVEIPEI